MNPEDEFAQWQAEQEFKEWQAQQSPGDAILARMNATNDRSKRESDRIAKNNADKAELGAPLSTSVVNMLDALSFGTAGLAVDAVSRGSFRDNRIARRMAKEGMSGKDRVLSTVAGALANPVTNVARPFQGAKMLARTGNAAVNVGAQAGAMGFTENLDDVTPAALLFAGKQGLKAGATGAALGAGGSLLYGAARGTRTLGRVAKAKPLDEAAFARNDAMKATDKRNYAALDAEIAATPSSPAIEDVLESQTVKPFADMVRKSEKFANANPSRVLVESLKLMSAAQRKALKSIEGTPEFLADIEMKTGDIGLAKGRMMSAAADPDPVLGIPGALESLPVAVNAHRVAKGELGALTETADAVRDILRGKSMNAEKKILIDSPEALRRAIKKMSPDEADAALEGLLGRAREEFRVTSNPLSVFGTVPSVARGIRLPGKLNEFIDLLEQQTGRKSTGLLSDLFSPKMGQKAEGLLGITTGSSY